MSLSAGGVGQSWAIPSQSSSTLLPQISAAPGLMSGSVSSQSIDAVKPSPSPSGSIGPTHGSGPGRVRVRLSITEPPAFWVTWRNVGPDFTALVRDFGRAGGSAWAYSFADKPTRPEIRFWRLAPGKYVLQVAVDADGDGKADGPIRQSIPFEYRRRLDSVRFDLPPRTLCLLEIEQTAPLPPLPKHMPDLAVAARDLTLSGEPVVGKPCRGKIIVHNIGSAVATGLTVRITASHALSSAGPKEIARMRHDQLDFPADLTAKRVALEFEWTPGLHGPYHLRAELSCAEPEIYLGNNAASISCDVLPRL